MKEFYNEVEVALVAPLAWSINILLVARQCSWYVIGG